MIVLADTSVWVDHFRHGNARFAGLLTDGAILIHPFVAGELACGNLRNRAAILSNLAALPPVPVATNDEILGFIEKRALWGRSLSLIDVHLLASTFLSSCRFWTLDKRLAAAAAELGVN